MYSMYAMPSKGDKQMICMLCKGSADHVSNVNTDNVTFISVCIKCIATLPNDMGIVLYAINDIYPNANNVSSVYSLVC